jgi:hypothetical protein
MRGSSFENIDWATDAITVVESQGAIPGNWAASFTTVNVLSKLRTFVGDTVHSYEPLLSVDGDVGQGIQRQLLGIPLLSVPVGIPDGVVWLIPSDNRIFAVVREDVQVAVSYRGHISQATKSPSNALCG